MRKITSAGPAARLIEMVTAV